MSSLWIAFQAAIVAAVGALLMIAMSNMRTLQRLGDHPLPAHLPRVSVLVPARNEEANIAPCLRSLLAQEYPDYEVLVLNDNSEDRTGPIVARLAAQAQHLRVLQGLPLPPGWQGKNWACHQLARAAQGELLLFTDADTRHHPRALVEAVAALLSQDADLVTAFPRQEVLSWSEQIMVPILTWCFMIFLPLRLAYRSHRPGLSVSMGQFMLFRRQAYDQIDGHQAVRHEVVEDMALARQVKAQSLRWRLVDGSMRVRCRMYAGFRQVVEGLSKNLFPGFRYNVSAFVLVLAVAGVVALEPVAVLLLHAAGAPIPNLPAGLAALAVGCTLLLTGLSYPRFDFPSYLVFIYPITTLITVGIAAFSLLLALLGRYTWKGRRLSRQRVRWW